MLSQMKRTESVRKEFAKSDRGARDEKVGALLVELEAVIDAMKGLPDSEFRRTGRTEMHKLEAGLRRLADRAQVAGSPFMSVRPSGTPVYGQHDLGQDPH